MGKNWHKVYLKSEGESEDGQSESENQLLYSRPIDRFWDVQVGVAHDVTPEATQTWGAIGVQGLAPYFFETNTVLLINDKSVGVRIDAEYEALITQKLVLSPGFKLNAYSSDNEQMGVGAGLANTELGLSLRYEFSRKFAPYIGVKWNQSYGKTESPLIY